MAVSIPVDSVASPKAAASVRRAGWLFSLPGVILLTLFLIVPFCFALVYAFTDRLLLQPPSLPWEFVGFRNFTDAFTDSAFLKALRNNAVFVIVVVPVQTALSLWLAVLVNQKLKGINIFRSIFFAPVITVMTVATVAWVALLDVDGLLSKVVHWLSFGLVDRTDWLGSTSLALISVMIIGIWQGAGFQMIILLAGLQEIPPDLYEAARIDGATKRQLFRYITLPGIRNQLIFTLTVTTILAFRVFDQIWAIPTLRGGPRGATDTMMVRIVDQGFAQGNIGYASAMSVIFFVIVVIVTIIQRRIIKEQAL
jgi:multiple sugar transport system permease protein